ncbi:MAG: GntR family transcriptional regulator [Acidimicrobiales bacterium]|nr:GntR family transcriptional regulator [Acidimicrobiales bacterium]
MSSDRDRAYEELHRRIVHLEIAPGEVIREAETMAVLGVGRTPLREAVQMLERDQLVTVVPRQGVFAGTVDIADLAELYRSRAALEPVLAEQAARRGTDAHWDEMAQVLAEVEGVDDVERLVDADTACHRIVWDAAGSRYLRPTVEMLYAHSDRLWRLYLADVTDMSNAVDEHRALHAALVAGDADRAAELTESHVRTFEAEVLEQLQAGMRAGSLARVR